MVHTSPPRITMVHISPVDEPGINHMYHGDGWRTYVSYGDGWRTCMYHSDGWRTYMSWCHDGWKTYMYHGDGWRTYMSWCRDGWRTYMYHGDGWILFRLLLFCLLPELSTVFSMRFYCYKVCSKDHIWPLSDYFFCSLIYYCCPVIVSD